MSNLKTYQLYSDSLEALYAFNETPTVRESKALARFLFAMAVAFALVLL